MESNSLHDKQYQNSQKFNARVLIHTKYAVNKRPWPIWLFSQYKFPENAKIIEFGCGNGLLWTVNSFRINPNWEITLSDFSEGMITTAQSSIGENITNIKYKVINLDNYHSNECYSNIIANHMLYHLQNRDRAIQSISKTLDKNGEFYATTVGNNDMKEMNEIIMAYTGNNNYQKAKGSIIDQFSLENGQEQLKKYFSSVKIELYEDALEITDADDFTNYVLSCNDLKPGITVLEEKSKDGFKNYIQDKINKEGKIHITKSSGTFIAKQLG